MIDKDDLVGCEICGHEIDPRFVNMFKDLDKDMQELFLKEYKDMEGIDYICMDCEIEYEPKDEQTN